MFTPNDYAVGTAAALKLIRYEVDTQLMPQVPMIFKNRIPVDKEPEAAAAITKCILDAVAASHPAAPAAATEAAPRAT